MSRRRNGGGPDGLVVVDKAPGPTSHDVVAACRRIYSTARVGHAGTLDPPATGVLCVGLGRVTRLLRYVTSGRKSYTAQVVFGATTDTMDSAGVVTGTWEMGGLDPKAVEAAAQSLRGEITQIPPMVSAVKVGGQRLHKLAREGVVVEREPRKVTIDHLELAPTEREGVWRMDVTCSAGTYVRVLADDLGRLCGGGAHLDSLRRTAVEPFRLDEAHSLERLAELGEAGILAPLEAVRALPRVHIDEHTAADVGHGRPFSGVNVGPVEPGPVAVVGPGGDLLAVYEAQIDGVLRPSVVLAAH